MIGQHQIVLMPGQGPILKVEIENPQTHERRVVKALFDTGAANVVILPSIAQILGLEEIDQQTLTGFGGHTEVCSVYDGRVVFPWPTNNRYTGPLCAGRLCNDVECLIGRDVIDGMFVFTYNMPPGSFTILY